MAAPDPMCQVWSWGANSAGQLGQGHSDDVLSPSLISESCIPFTPFAITGGGSHTLFISESGRCFSCGCNNRCQLGTTTECEDMKIPKPVNLPKEAIIVAIAAGWDSSYAITEDGKLYVWGSNKFGQLGFPASAPFVATPILAQIPGHVKAVAAGLRHALVIKDDGSVLVCGSGKKGQLGLVDEDGSFPMQCPTWAQLSNLPGGKPLSCVAGTYHSAIMTEEGEVISWGDNKYGQLGLGISDALVTTPHIIKTTLFEDNKVCNLQSGWTHMIAMTENGAVWSWGRAIYGQTGHIKDPNEKVTQYSQPRRLDNISLPQSIYCGSEHNLLVTDTGGLVSWGWNEHGMCGSGKEVDVDTPQPVEKLKEKTVLHGGCGAGHSFAVVKFS